MLYVFLPVHTAVAAAAHRVGYRSPGKRQMAFMAFAVAWGCHALFLILSFGVGVGMELVLLLYVASMFTPPTPRPEQVRGTATGASIAHG